MTLRDDLEEFVSGHHSHGPMTGDATEPEATGYTLTVACPCGVVFERWVTPEDARAGLLRAAFAELTSATSVDHWGGNSLGSPCTVLTLFNPNSGRVTCGVPCATRVPQVKVSEGEQDMMA